MSKQSKNGGSNKTSDLMNSINGQNITKDDFYSQKRDIDFLLKEFKRMQNAIERLQINQTPNVSLKTSRKSVPKQSDTYINDVSLRAITDFIKDQRRINYELQNRLSKAKTFQTNPSDNPLKKDLDHTPAQVRMQREINEAMKEINNISGKVAITEKDILSLTEMQRIVVADVESLKIDKDSRFKLQGFKLNPRKSDKYKAQPGSFEEDVESEISNLKIQNESLYEKSNVNNDKIMRLQGQLVELIKENKRNQNDYPLNKEIAFNARMDKLEMDIQRVEEKIEKANYELGKELRNMSSTTGYKYPNSDSNGKNKGSHFNGNSDQMKDLIRKETEHIFTFIQEFVNEIAIYNTSVVKSEDKGANDKMDSIDWFARNIEFVSPHIFQKFIESCQSLLTYPGPSNAKTALFHSKNNSTALLSLKRLIVETQDQNASIGVKQQLPSYLRLLEICLMNMYNCEKARSLSIDQLLINVVVSKSSQQIKGKYMKPIKNSQVDEKSHNVAKVCLSLLVVNNINIMHKLIEKEYFCTWLASTDLNGIAKESNEMGKTHLPVFKILEAVFKSTSVSEQLLKANPSLVNELIQMTWRSYSCGEEAVLIQNLKTIRQFSKLTSLSEVVSPPEMIQILIDLSNDCPVVEAKRIIYETLKNFTGQRQFNQIIRNSGLLDLIQAT